MNGLEHLSLTCMLFHLFAQVPTEILVGNLHEGRPILELPVCPHHHCGSTTSCCLLCAQMEGGKCAINLLFSIFYFQFNPKKLLFKKIDKLVKII